MTLYVDSSALIKRYIAEDDSEAADAILLADTDWVTGRHTFVEVSLEDPSPPRGGAASGDVRGIRPRLATHIRRGARRGGVPPCGGAWHGL
jgi:hypothetical protein